LFFEQSDLVLHEFEDIINAVVKIRGATCPDFSGATSIIVLYGAAASDSPYRLDELVLTYAMSDAFARSEGIALFRQGLNLSGE
jgi:hypothetical protein